MTTGNRPPIRKRLLVAVLVLVAFVAPSPATCQSLINDGPASEGPADFVDKWVISGNAIGNSVGAVAGQMLVTALFGPAGWVVGSLVGSFAGGMLGEYVDNKIHKSYNYAAFNRPPLGEPGSLILKDAGPLEQLLYQIDARAINGGNMATFAAHFGMNLIGRSIPGCAGLLNPVLMIVVDYLAGILGDNLDGLVDPSAVGARLDRARGFDPAAAEVKAGWEIYKDRPLTARELYQATVDALRDRDVTVTEQQQAKAQRLLESYQGAPSAAAATATTAPAAAAAAP